MLFRSGRFAERLQIRPSYWSQIKSRSRQIGERLARQFEQLCHKPAGWMDLEHGAMAVPAGDAAPTEPKDDDERFIIGLVLTYYRRHPQRARTRLLDLLGEVLMPSTATTPPATPAAPGKPAPGKPPQAPAAKPAPAAPADDAMALWSRTQAGVAPLKRKR